MRRLRPSLAFFAALVVACQAGAPPASEAPGAASGSARTLAVVVSGPAGAPVIGANVCAFTLAGVVWHPPVGRMLKNLWQRLATDEDTGVRRSTSRSR